MTPIRARIAGTYVAILVRSLLQHGSYVPWLSGAGRKCAIQRELLSLIWRWLARGTLWGPRWLPQWRRVRWLSFRCQAPKILIAIAHDAESVSCSVSIAHACSFALSSEPASTGPTASPRYAMTRDSVDAPRCPTCSGPMELKVAQRGPTAGNSFWGCRRYPLCRGSVDVFENLKITTETGDGLPCPACGSQMEMRVPQAGSASWACTRFPACSGTRDVDPNTADGQQPAASALAIQRPTDQGRVSLQEGGFVWTDDRALVGKLMDLSPGRALVRIFHSAVDSEDCEYEPDQLERAFLSPQTRVFVFDEAQETWSSGRVIDYDLAAGPDGLAYSIRFPGRADKLIAERDLAVRCFAPTVDPTHALAEGGIESQFFHDRRLRALAATLAHRSASASVSGLVSGSVDLRLHQLHIVRRVIEDPIQRYLLADEVGLGKTIEAGAIIRQLLIERPSSRVVVVAPTPLLWQWQRELREKFDIESDGKRLTLCDMSRIDELVDDGHGFDLLVVDEAHHVFRRGGTARSGYQPLAELSQKIERLLLLTATPVLSNDAATLSLLHLIDPVTYPVDDLAGFRSRLERRQQYAELVLALDPDVPVALLRSTASQIATLLPHDQEVTTYCSAVIDPGLTDEERRVAIQNLRHHVSDMYRLDHRLMRTRRSDAGLSDRACPIITEPDDDSRVEDVAALLEQWRADATDAATPDNEARLALLYQELFEGLGRGLGEYADVLRARSDELYSGTPEAFIGELELVSNSLTACQRKDDGMSRLELCVDALKLALRALSRHMGGNQPHLVAFTSSTPFARKLVTSLQRLPRITVAAVTSDLEHFEVDAAVSSFVTSVRPAILVADRSAEEGLNLQVADGLLHMDLPLAPERLEQRIGRLDRLGRRRPDIPTRVVLPSDEDGSPWLAWHELLRDGFGLYSRSISDVHFLLDELQERACLAILRRGAAGLAELTSAVRDSLDDERRRLDRQYALEQLDLEGRDAWGMFDRVRQAEGRADQFAEDVGGWLFDALGFGCERHSNDSFRTHWRHHTRVPEHPGWKERFDPALKRPLTFHRERALADADVRLVRPGFALVDEMLSLMHRDDRGTAFATWRADPRWPADSSEWLGFRLTYVVEVDEDRLRELIQADASISFEPVQRAASDLFVPWLETRDYDAQFMEVTNGPLHDILERDYDRRSDLNLASRPDLIESVVDRQYFATLCREVRARSEELLRREAQFARRLASAKSAAQQLLAKQAVRLDRRWRALESLGENDPSLARRRLVVNALQLVVASPRLRLEAIGAFVVSHAPPRCAQSD